MPRKKPIPFPTRQPSTLPRIIFRTILTVLIGIGLLSLLVWLSNRAGQSVANQPRYDVLISSIVVDPPPGVEKDAFLTEVRAAGNLTESISAVSAETPATLAAAFDKHPWVADVKRVSVRTDKTIHVELEYRIPALIVPMIGSPATRLVDKTGSLLPPTATIPDHLPMLKIDNPRPLTASGTVPDDTVKRAAELVDIYKANQPRMIEKLKSGWRITPAVGSPLFVSF